MAVTEQELREKYELFNSDDPSAIVDQFALNAVYYQADSDLTAIGYDEIAEVMAGWRTFFADAKIEDVRIVSAEELVDQYPDAAQSFVVDFIGVGRYVQTMPGLEKVAPARGQLVRLPIRETIWLKEDGQFVRVENGIEVAALL